MIVEFDKSFLKSLDKIKDSKVFPKIKSIITEIEKAQSLNELKSVKKLIGFKNYYRIRLGKYRLGFEVIDSITVRLIIIAHRKDIYRIFP